MVETLSQEQLIRVDKLMLKQLFTAEVVNINHTLKIIINNITKLPPWQ